MKNTTYKNFPILYDKYYNTYNGYRTIEEAKQIIDIINVFNHLDWLITYYDIDNHEISSYVLKNCPENIAEGDAYHKKPSNANDYSVLQLGLFVWQRVWKHEWKWPEIQNNNVLVKENTPVIEFADHERFNIK